MKTREKIMCFIVCFLISVMYYDSSSRDSYTILLQDHSTIGKEVLWTWVCQNDTCERHHTTDGFPIQSLITCSMVCGQPKLWPLPTGPHKLSKTIVPVEPDLYFLQILKSPSQVVSDYITNAFHLFENDLRKLVNKASYRSIAVAPYKVLVYVSVDKDDDPRLRLDTDESYRLNLHPNHDKKFLTANLAANSFCGFRNGLETLLQLVWLDPYKNSLMSIDEAKVQDAPKFKYRGLMLDTARNYFPVESIMRTLDAMGANKLNTFHWHATDSQSFPLALKAAPQLAQQGAYRRDAIYSRKDIKAIVLHAALRGIRVLIEIDAPSHVGPAFSWGPAKGLGDLVLCAEMEPWNKYCGEPPCGQLNPLNKNIYSLLEKLYVEIIDLTGVTDVFHLGGDELNDNCWRNFIKSEKPVELLLQFIKEAHRALERANGGKPPDLTMIWSSELTVFPYLNALDRARVGVQLWGAWWAPGQQAVLLAGYRGVISHVDPWYLDCGMGSWLDDSEGHCAPYRQWQDVYTHRPWEGHSTIWRVEGGEACVWSEQLSPTGLDTRIWPRASALAERLWTDPRGLEMNDVILRLEMQRARMLARDVGVNPIWPKWCTQNPHACLS